MNGHSCDEARRQFMNRMKRGIIWLEMAGDRLGSRIQVQCMKESGLLARDICEMYRISISNERRRRNVSKLKCISNLHT